MKVNLPYRFTRLLILSAVLALPGLLLAQPVTLPYQEGFENVPGGTQYTANTTNIPSLAAAGITWDYEINLSGGRVRFDAFAHTGNAGATCDDIGFSTPSNFLTVELDMTDYILASDLELSFYFNDHGDENHPNDRVWIRGSDTDPWIQVYDLTNGPVGQWQFASGIDVDAELAANGQAPSSTFAIRFGQEDNSTASSLTGLDGITFDDILLEGTVPLNTNAKLEAILSPTDGCEGLLDVQVEVCNVGLLPLSNIPVTASVDGNVFNGTVAGPVAANTCETITLGTINLSGSSTGIQYDVSGFVSLAGDQSLSNDTIDTFNITIYGQSGLLSVVNTSEAINNTLAPVQSGTYVCGHPVLDNCFKVKALHIDTLNHTWLDDLDIFLISPAGTVMEISTDNGGSLNDMLDVSFVRNAPASQDINNFQNGIPAGDYLPEENAGFDIFSGEDPNGEWILQITDDAGGDNGELIQWSLEFENANVSLGLDTVVCDSQFVLNPGAQFATYDWQDGSTDQTFVVTEPGTHVYSLTTTDNDGTCTSSAQVSVSIGSQVDLGPDFSICSNESFTFDLGPAFTSATWHDGSTDLTYTTNSVEVISVDVIDSVGCHSSDMVIVEEIFQIVPVDLGPDVAVCEGEFVVLDAGSGYVSYQWAQGEQSQQVLAVTTGIRTVVATDINGCEVSDDIFVEILSPPVLTAGLGQGMDNIFATPGTVLPFAVDPSYISIWEITQLSGTSVNVNNTYDLTVELGPNLVDVHVTDTNGCENERLVYIFNYPVSVNDPVVESGLSLFPNPSNGPISIRNEGPAFTASVHVLNVLGQTVLREPARLFEQGALVSLDFSTLPAGQYIVQLASPDRMDQIQVVIE